MKLKLLSVIVLLSTLSSCGLKEAIGPVSGTSTSDSYQPVSAGSTWKYNSQFTGAPDNEITIKMTGAKTTINGKIYYDYTSSSAQLGVSTGYYYQGGDIYRSRGTSAQAGATVDMLYLDNTKPVGGTWTAKINDSGFINGVPGQFVGKILEKNVSKTVGGKTFTDAIHIAVDLQYDYGLGSGFETLMSYDYYVAKGVGLIETDTSVFGSVIGRQTIVSYNVK